MICNFTSFTTVFQSYQDNGRVAGRFSPVPIQTLFFFFFFFWGGGGTSYSFSSRWFRPNFRGGLLWLNFVGSLWPTLFLINFQLIKSFSIFPNLFPTCCYRHLQFCEFIVSALFNNLLYYMHNKEIPWFPNKLKVIITSGLGRFISSKKIFPSSRFYFSNAICTYKRGNILVTVTCCF